MEKILKDFIYFTDNENIEKLNNEMCKNFYLKKEEIKDKNIKKVQFDNLTFGIYFSKADDNKGRILVLKNKKKITTFRDAPGGDAERTKKPRIRHEMANQKDVTTSCE